MRVVLDEFITARLSGFGIDVLEQLTESSLSETTATASELATI